MNFIRYYELEVSNFRKISEVRRNHKASEGVQGLQVTEFTFTTVSWDVVHHD